MLSSSFLFSVKFVLLSIYALTLSLLLVDLPRALLRILSNISDGVFCEKVQRFSVGNHFRKKASSQVFDSFLDTTTLLIGKASKNCILVKLFYNRNLNLAGHACSIHCTGDYYNSLVCLKVSLPLRKIHTAKPISLYKNRPHRDTLIS